MCKKYSLVKRRKLIIRFIYVSRIYDAKEDMELRFMVPANFNFGENNKILLEKIGTIKNDILLECKNAKYSNDKMGSYVVNIKKEMLSKIQNDDGMKYRFIYLDTKNEIIGASPPFKFSANHTPSMNVFNTINELGNIIYEESSEKENIIRILLDELDNIKNVFKIYYNKMNSIIPKKEGITQFEEFLSISNAEKEKKIEEMTEKIIKLKISSSDIILREIKVIKDDIINKISGENNKLYNLMLNYKKSCIIEENIINDLAKEISSKIEQINNAKYMDINDKLKEINDRISHLNYFKPDKITEDKPNVSDITLDSTSSESLANPSGNSNSKIRAFLPENSSFEIIEPITVNNTSSTEGVVESTYMMFSKGFNSTPIDSNEERKSKKCPVCSYVFEKENIKEMYLHVESHYFGSEKDIIIKSKI